LKAALLWTLLGVALAWGGTCAAAVLLGGEDPVFRSALYAAAGVGTVIGVSGLPFAWQIVRGLDNDPHGARMWSWWGAGSAVRLLLLLGGTYWLGTKEFPEYRQAVNLAVMGVYLTVLFAELAWFYRLLTRHEEERKAAQATKV
jgi:hypothetical protein